MFGSMKAISGITFEALCFLLFLYSLLGDSNTLQASHVPQSSKVQFLSKKYLYFPLKVFQTVFYFSVNRTMVISCVFYFNDKVFSVKLIK